MSMAIRSSLLVVITLLPANVHADGIIVTLPEDGAWVEYHTTLKFDTTETIGKVVLRSVGTESFAGKDCRWIEIEMTAGDDPRQIVKMLIPEENLAAGFDPVDHAVKVWRKTGEEDPEQIENAAVDLSFVGAMLHAPVKESEKLPEREFAWQRGTFKASGGRGTRPIGDRLEGTLTASTWKDAKVPFGVAGIRVVIKPEKSTSVLRLEMSVNDFGKDAKSALPDAR